MTLLHCYAIILVVVAAVALWSDPDLLLCGLEVQTDKDSMASIMQAATRCGNEDQHTEGQRINGAFLSAQ